MLALALVGLLVEAVAAPHQYERLRFAPYEVFEAMLAYAEQGDFEPLLRGASYASPLFEALPGGAEVERQLKKAAATRDSRAALAAVQRLLLIDLRFNMRGAAGPGGLERERLQMAFVDYHFLAPRVRAADARLDRRIRAAFRTAYETGDTAELRAATQTLPAALKVEPP